MKEQYENLVMTSLMLYVDHSICVKGEAYTNHSGVFYPIENLYNNAYTYASPYKQLVCDSGIANRVNVTPPDLMSGVYINDKFIGTGTSGFMGINHHEGQIYFNQDVSSHSLSGYFSVKDFNVKITSAPEEELLFETKFDIRPKTTVSPTGLSTEEQTYPAIYLKNNGGTNSPFAFGGEDLTRIDARAIILSDSAFSLDATCSILKDLNTTYIPILEKEELPFNASGMATGNWTPATTATAPGVGYDYTGIVEHKTLRGESAYISEVFVSKIVANRGDFKNINTDVYTAFVDFSIEKQRFPRH